MSSNRLKDFGEVRRKIKNFVNLNNIPEHGYIFKNLNTLVSFIESFDTEGCYFRGQSGLWHIISSLHRFHETDDEQHASIIFSVVITELLKNPFIKKVIQEDQNNAIAIAQHYGCPTDFVDITTDINIAAYFACLPKANRKFEYGCVWVFCEFDFVILQALIESSIEQFDDDIKRYLICNNYNPLIVVKIPELSRLNAQKGAFIWDIHGTLDCATNEMGVGYRFVFKHSDNELEMLNLDKDLLFPSPNPLETEIMRLLLEYATTENGLHLFTGASLEAFNQQTSVVLKYLKENNKVTIFPVPNLFEPSFGGYQWPKREICDDNHTYPTVDDMAGTELICFSDIDYDVINRIVGNIICELENGNYCKYNILVKGDKKLLKSDIVLSKIVQKLLHYLYNYKSISDVIRGYIDLAVFTCSNPSYKNIGLIEAKYSIDPEVILTKYYNDDVVYMGIDDGIASAGFYMPKSYKYFDSKCFGELCDFLQSNHMGLVKHITSNQALAFQLQANPRKVLSFDKTLSIFEKYILPQELLFSSPSSSIYIPDYLKSFGLH